MPATFIMHTLSDDNKTKCGLPVDQLPQYEVGQDTTPCHACVNEMSKNFQSPGRELV